MNIKNSAGGTISIPDIAFIVNTLMVCTIVVPDVISTIGCIGAARVVAFEFFEGRTVAGGDSPILLLCSRRYNAPVLTEI